MTDQSVGDRRSPTPTTPAGDRSSPGDASGRDEPARSARLSAVTVRTWPAGRRGSRSRRRSRSGPAGRWPCTRRRPRVRGRHPDGRRRTAPLDGHRSTVTRTTASGRSTIGRSNSMWAATGAMSTARWRGIDDRTAHREGVGGRPGGRGEDESVAHVGRERPIVELDVEADRVAHVGLLDHGLVERTDPLGLPRLAFHRHVEPHSFLDRVRTGEEPLERHPDARPVRPP